ncbi:pentapeptide repeat-containing protein [Virgibacillus halophilus]|uniref:Pentapeptide repeat-containing protein n=1 Tax=Tigheibacillus halophilus TaxID=361280 RepID=A0ABU5C6Z9_9BACI|nr:pentapeptide repeat-containing protein [Virgibacillus halophilus]
MHALKTVFTIAPISRDVIWKDFHLRGEVFNQTIFETSSLKRASFRNATLNNVQFRLSDVKKIDFDGTIMDKLTYNFLKGSKAELNNVTLI